MFFECKKKNGPQRGFYSGPAPSIPCISGQQANFPRNATYGPVLVRRPGAAIGGRAGRWLIFSELRPRSLGDLSTFFGVVVALSAPVDCRL